MYNSLKTSSQAIFQETSSSGHKQQLTSLATSVTSIQTVGLLKDRIPSPFSSSYGRKWERKYL